MKYIPILFSTLMVQALLAGRKTMTRRVIKPEGKNVAFDISMHTDGSNKWPRNIDADERFISFIKCPYGKVGDVLWVRENYSIYINYDNQVYIKFEGRENFDVYNKKEISLNTLTKIKNRKLKPNEWHSCPSIHLYKEFASIFLEITNIRVERLQDISEQDAVSEGILPLMQSATQIIEDGKQYLDYFAKVKNFFTDGLCAKRSFQSLWQSINGAGSWNKNPWVWVIEFKQINKPDNFN